MEHTYSPKQFGNLIGKPVTTLHEQYLQYRVLISSEQGVVIASARVSSSGQKKELAMQKEALRASCQEHGIKVDQWIEDTGSALNYKRRGFHQVIEQIELGQAKRLIIGFQDRLVRFGYDWFEQFCERHGSQITMSIGERFSPEAELVRDLMAIVMVFSARLHGLRSPKHLNRAAALLKDVSDDQGA